MIREHKSLRMADLFVNTSPYTKIDVDWLCIILKPNFYAIEKRTNEEYSKFFFWK